MEDFHNVECFISDTGAGTKTPRTPKSQAEGDAAGTPKKPGTPADKPTTPGRKSKTPTDKPKSPG